MPTRKCVKCGAPFERRYEDQFLCEACAAKSKANFAVKLKDRTCRTCGTTFKGGPRAWYCPTCRAERERVSRRKRNQHPPRRKLGSIDQCENCGKDYIVNSGLQRYCPECAPLMAQKKRNLISREWNKEHLDREAIKADRAQASSIRFCSVCGKEFSAEDAVVFQLDICSPECLSKYRLEHPTDPTNKIAIDDVVSTYQATKSLLGTAKHYGVTPYVVCRCLITRNIYDNLPPIAQQIRDMYDRGMKNADIAQALNISVATVRTYEPYNTTTKTIKASRK